jgi:hypothetical protein
LVNAAFECGLNADIRSQLVQDAEIRSFFEELMMGLDQDLFFGHNGKPTVFGL